MLFSRLLLICLICGVISGLNSQELATKEDSINYSIGIVLAQTLKEDGIREINASLISQALQDVFSSSIPLLKNELAEKLYSKTLKDLKDMINDENRLAGEMFLSENAKKPGVVSLPSGLQYEILAQGEGTSPGITDKVTTHYHGTLIDGTVFDSSVERQEPISFPLSRVIKAWQEALPMMKIGSKWRIYSPFQLAYGERAAPPVIKPYSALIFEIELLEIQ